MRSALTLTVSNHFKAIGIRISTCGIPVILLLSALLLNVGSSSGQAGNCGTAGVAVWTGASSSEWSDPSNWCGGVPALSSAVTIPAVSATFHVPLITGADISIGSLSIESGASLTLSGISSLSLSLDMSISSGGTYITNGCATRFTGTGSQSLSCDNPVLLLSDLVVSCPSLVVSRPPGNPLSLTCRDVSISSGSSCQLSCNAGYCRSLSVAVSGTCDLSALSLFSCAGSLSNAGECLSAAFSEFTCASGTCTVSGMSGSSSLHNMQVACPPSSLVVLSGDLSVDAFSLVQGRCTSEACNSGTGTCASLTCSSLSVAASTALDLHSLSTLSCSGAFSNAGAFTSPPLTRFTCTSGTCTVSGLSGASSLHDVLVDCPLSSSVLVSGDITMDAFSLTQGRCVSECTSGTGTCASFTCSSITTLASTMCDMSSLSTLSCAGSFSMLGQFRAPELTRFTCASGTCTIDGDMTALNKIRKIDCSNSGAVPAKISFSGSLETGALSLVNTELTAECGSAATCLTRTLSCGDISIDATSTFNGSKLPKLTSVGALATALGRFIAPALTEFTCASGTCTVSGLSGQNSLHGVIVNCPPSSVVVISGDITMDDLSVVSGQLSAEQCSTGTCPPFTAILHDLSVSSGATLSMPAMSRIISSGSFSNSGTFVSPPLTTFTCASGACTVSGASGSNKFSDVEISCASNAVVSLSSDIDMHNLSVISGKLAAPTCTANCRVITCNDLSVGGSGQLDASQLAQVTCDGSFSNLGQFTCPPTTKFTCSSGACTLSGDMMGPNAFSELVFEGADGSLISSASPITATQVKAKKDRTTIAPRLVAAALLGSRISVSPGASLDLSGAVLEFAASPGPVSCVLDDQSLSTNPSKYGDVVVGSNRALSLSSSRLFLYGGMQCDGSVSGQTAELTFTGSGDVALSGSSSTVSFPRLSIAKGSFAVSCTLPAFTVSDLALSSGVLHCGSSVVTLLHSLSNDCSVSCLDAGSSRFIFAGTTSIQGSSSTRLHHITCNTPAGVSLLRDLSFTGELLLTEGVISTGASTLTCESGCTVSGGGPTTFVYGKFKAGTELATTVVKKFPIGTMDGTIKRYSPVSVTLHDVSVAGGLTFSATEDPHPDFSNSGLSLQHRVSTRFTAVPDLSLSFSSSEVSLQYDASASTGDPSLYRVAKFDAPSTWTSPPVLARTASSITVVVDSYSDLLIGEPGCSSDGEWTGAVSSQWSNPLNWCSGTVPTATTQVIVRPVNDPPVVDAVASAASVSIEAGASLTVSSTGKLVMFGGSSSGTGSTLSVSGQLQLQPNGGEIIVHGAMSVALSGSVSSSGSLSVDGDLDVQGEFLGADGTLNLTGSSLTDMTWSGTTSDPFTVRQEFGPVRVVRQARTGRNPQTGKCSSLTIVSGELALDGASSELQVDGDVSVYPSAKLICGSTHLYVTGGWDMQGDMDEGTSVVEFKGAGSKELTGTVSLLKFYDLVVAKTGGGMVKGNINIANARMQAHTVSLSSGSLEAGTLTDIAVSGDWKVDAGALFTYGTCSVSFTGTDPQTIGGGTALATALGKAINTKPLTGTANRLFVSTPELDLEDLVLISGKTQVGLSNVQNTKVNISGSILHTGGEFFPETSKFEFTGSGTHNISGQPISFHDIDVDGDAILTVDPLTELSVTGDMSIYGAKQGSSGRTKFTGDEEQFFTYSPVAGAPVSNFADLSFENTSPQGVTITGDNIHPIVGGTAEFSGHSKLLKELIYAKAIVKALAVVTPSAAGKLSLSGDMTVSGQYDGQLGAVSFTGSADQVFDYSPDAMALASNFGILSFSNTGGTSGATVQVQGSGSPLTAGSVAVVAGTTVLHVKVIAQDGVSVETYGVLSMPGATELSVGGDWTNDGVFNAGAGTVIFNGAGTSHISGSSVTEAFNDMISTCPDLHDDRALLVVRNLSIPAGTLRAGAVMEFSGSIDLGGSGSFDPNGGTCKFHSNSLNQLVSGAVDFHNLELDNPTGLSFTGGAVALDGTLTFTNGHIRLLDHDLSLSVVAVISGASRDRYIETPALGSLRMYVPHSVVPAIFPIGSASSYSPVSLSLSGSSGTGGAMLGSRVRDVQPSATYTGDTPDASAAIEPRSILKTYFETGDIPTQDQLTMTVQWSVDAEPPAAFDRTHCDIAHYVAGPGWDYGAASAAISLGGGVYTQTRSGFTSLSPFAIFSQQVTCTVPASPYCAGQAATVNYTASGGSWNAANTFQAELSDASGNFPGTIIGSLASNALTGSINATIPAGTTAGTAYRIRVNSTDPAGDGVDNGSALSITTCTVTVHAEPGISNVYMTDQSNTTVNTNALSFGQVYKLVVPLFNDNADNALPAGSTTVTVDLDTKMAVDLSFSMLTAPLSQYFHWSHAVVAGHDIITGVQYADIPADWFGSGIFNVVSTGSCKATVHARFIADNHASTITLVDENINNNTAAIFYNSPVTLTATPVPVTCFGTVTGNIIISSSPGTTVTVTNASAQVVTAPFAAGTYTVTATASPELPFTTVCSEVRTVTITEPAAVVVGGAATNASCFGTATGSVDITVAGGSGSYTYVWSNAATTQDLVNVPAGSYTVTVTESNSCSVTGTFTYIVGQPTALAATASATDIECHGGNATVTILATGGTGPYSYTFNSQTNSNGVFTGVLAGTALSYTVTDAHSCSTGGTITITEPTGTSADISLGSDYEANFFGSGSIGTTYRIVYNVTEIAGNPAVGDTIRIIKSSGYTISLDNAAISSTIGLSNYMLDNGNWKIDDTNPSFASIIMMDPTHTNGIPGTLGCSRKVYVEVTFKRNTVNASTFSLSARLRKTGGELNQGNNLNSIVFTAE